MEGSGLNGCAVVTSRHDIVNTLESNTIKTRSSQCLVEQLWLSECCIPFLSSAQMIASLLHAVTTGNIVAFDARKVDSRASHFVVQVLTISTSG